jgi:hypothetical protein
MVAVPSPSGEAANSTMKGDVCLEITVGVDLELITRRRIETDFESGGVRVDVEDQHRVIAATPATERCRGR